MTINVKKRDGAIEPLNLEKFHKVVSWACEGLSNVSESEVEIKSQIQFYNNIRTIDIQETLIKAASELITEATPNYQYVASRLINYHLRKQVYNGPNPCSLFQHVVNVVSDGYYEINLLSWYDDEEYKILDSYLVHTRDFNIPYAGMEQLRGKYLIRNRATNKYYETPQMSYMLIAMVLFHKYPKNERLKWVKDFYDATSTFEISLPTPIMAGLRSPQKQFSSCVLIDSDDSLDSINATTSSIVKYVSQKAGIGINAGRIRAIGSPIRNGDATHTGLIPFYKMFQAAVRSCSQGGVRNGAATLFYPVWHYEVEDLIVLKNNKGTEENRIRHMDYAVQFNKLMYERLLSGGNITLFSPSDVPGLYDAFFVDYDRFKQLYEEAEQNPNIRKKIVSALTLFGNFIQERKDTGRIYLMNVDHANDHGSFIKEVAPVTQSNLCMEVLIANKPQNHFFDEEAEIALCTLAAINWGKIRATYDFERPARLIVRALDELLDYQDYPVVAAKNSTMARRPLGVGITNFAYWLAKNDLTYSNIGVEGLKKVHEYTEAWSYYIIKASADLAQEKGACPKSTETKYSLGVLPIDTYKKNVDNLVDPVYKMDWNSLRIQLSEYGIRNSTLMCAMPCETSSQLSNSTNGIEPVRALISIKQSKDGVLKQVVPESKRLKNKYDLLWDQKSPEGYLQICAVLQKFIDQAISVNTSYNPKHYDNDQIPMSVLMKDIIQFYQMGGKNLYYFNTFDGAGEQEVLPELEQSKVEDESCDSCTI